MQPGIILAGGNCGENDCPAILTAGDGMVLVRGYRQDDVVTPDGEIVASIPAALVMEAARALAGLAQADEQ